MDWLGVMMGLIVNPLIWVLLLIGLAIGAFIFLKIRKSRKLRFPACEVVDLGGQGKTSINFLGAKGAGWFGKNLFLFGLWDYGDEIMRTRDMEIIEQFSEEDFQEVNGRRGIIFYRDPIRRLLFPINKLAVANKELVTEIAPADYTDTGLSIIRSGEQETQDWKEKVIQAVIWALTIIFVLVAIILVIQYAKSTQQEAAATILEAGRTCLENARMVCSEIVNQFAQPSTAP